MFISASDSGSHKEGKEEVEARRVVRVTLAAAPRGQSLVVRNWSRMKFLSSMALAPPSTSDT